MTGTIVNIFAIIAGAFIGVLLKKGIPERINEAVIKIQGLAVAIIALNGIISAMFTAENGRLSDSGGLLLLVSLVLGCVAGELMRIDDRINGMGLWIEKRLGAEGFAKGFVTASLIFSIGAMALIGSINDGLRGDSSVLFVKSALDFTTAVILAASLGFGVAFAALPVLVLQGGVSLLAGAISPFITDELLRIFCMTGYAIVLCIGLNFLVNTKIKVANLLPAVVISVIYYFVRDAAGSIVGAII